MNLTPRSGHGYQDINIGGSSRVHMGDAYYRHGPSPDERALSAILESLSYPGMFDRRDALAEAHEGTFDWTFLEGETQILTNRSVYSHKSLFDTFATINVNFKDWLHEGRQGLFCIRGKAGSGKSTFMYVSKTASTPCDGTTDHGYRKSLATRTELEDMLQTWAAGQTLLRADHYFWILGSPKQKSIEGLLRSLLFAVFRSLSLAEQPGSIEAIKQICSTRWNSSGIHGTWSCKELKDMVHRLTSAHDAKIFLVVDALDECEPQDRLGDLVDTISWLSRLRNMKLCVSYRPWTVFQKLEEAPMLHLDQLTYRDMATYIEARLTSTEAEVGWNFEFRDQTEPAKRLIFYTARAAGGVFLWTELVVKAICSEIRKGKSIDQIDQIIAGFPSDLDGYFQQLIFNRIGASQRNITDTAAALKLAMEVEFHERTHRYSHAYEASPMARSFMNFWLLSEGRLVHGFSWEDFNNVPQPCVERMLDQTANFLDETCKDLLTLNRDRRSSESSRVEFLHRTVFDFLSDNKVDFALECRAPKHFSDKDFIFDLSRLRCLCLLRIDYDEPHMIALLHSIINIYRDLTHLEVHVSWLLTCESLVVAHVRSRTPIYMDVTWMDKWDALCVKAGTNQVVSELYKIRPFGVLRAREYPHNLPVLGYLLFAMNSVEIRRPDMNLLRQVLEYGCDPNSHVGNWPTWKLGRLLFESSVEDVDDLFWCRRTLWQAWLGEAYIRFVQSGNSHPRLGIANEVDELFELRRRELGAMTILLLQYGADPHCMLCVTDHELEPHDGNNCIRLALLTILERITSACTVKYLRNLLPQCSRETTAYRLRRNQLRRALRTFMLPGGSEEWEYTTFLGYLTGGTHNECSRCSADSLDVRLTTWCIDCQQQSDICHRCAQSDISETAAFEQSCQASAGISGISADDHTVVTFVYRSDQDFDNDEPPDMAEAEFADSMGVQYNTAEAINTLKAWYAKDPIEPNLSFEEAILIRTPPSSIDGMQKSGGGYGSMLTQQRATSSRPWLL
jgi:hypothetical protein